MANKSLFSSSRGAQLPAATAINHEGAPAYALEPKHALAQYAATGCLSNTFYASAGEQLNTVLSLHGSPSGKRFESSQSSDWMSCHDLSHFF
jgi:60 kDa SS-A/Ro ribonucleoprotein